MAEIQPLTAVHYDLRVVGSLDAVAAPPYDVIDGAQRAELAARSPFNVVEVDLPRADGGDPYLHAQSIFETWIQQGIVLRDREPALWALTQEYVPPGSDRALCRRGFFCRVRVENYGAGLIRPHERTQPGPKEDRLRLTRATRANLSPIFSLFPDPENRAWAAIEPTTSGEPFGALTDDSGVVNRIWRVADQAVISSVSRTLAEAELLIADGHHRYETARIYADEVGGEGDHRYVLMYLCSLSDPGLTVLPTHRLLSNLKDSATQERLGTALKRDFEVEQVEHAELAPPTYLPGIVFGYMDAHLRRPFRLTLKAQEIADAAMPDRMPPYRELEPAILEALVLRGALGMSEADIEEKRGIEYASDFAIAIEAVENGRCDAAFFMRAPALEKVRAVAQAGESMPPKSTYFFPKVPTGLLFNPLE